MSWIVSQLIRNSLMIKEAANKESITTFKNFYMQDVEQFNEEKPIELHSSPLDNDEYNDVLLVDKAIEHLKNIGSLSEKDMELVEYLRGGGTVASKNRSISGSRMSLAKRETEISDRIAFYLGGYFTDDGYLDYMRNKYKWSDVEMEIGRAHV